MFLNHDWQIQHFKLIWKRLLDQFEPIYLENNTWFSAVLLCMYWQIIHRLYHNILSRLQPPVYSKTAETMYYSHSYITATTFGILDDFCVINFFFTRSFDPFWNNQPSLKSENHKSCLCTNDLFRWVRPAPLRTLENAQVASMLCARFNSKRCKQWNMEYNWAPPQPCILANITQCILNKLNQQTNEIPS